MVITVAMAASVSGAPGPIAKCRQFKIRALKVKVDPESAVPGVSVITNPEKPRNGCIETRGEGDEVFILLPSMPRPFTAMKKLDMDEVIKDSATHSRIDGTILWWKASVAMVSRFTGPFELIVVVAMK